MALLCRRSHRPTRTEQSILQDDIFLPSSRRFKSSSSSAVRLIAYPNGGDLHLIRNSRPIAASVVLRTRASVGLWSGEDAQSSSRHARCPGGSGGGRSSRHFP